MIGFKNLEIIRSIDRGIQYLYSKKQGDHWHGFPTLAGHSDIWVTGFILSHLKMIRDHLDLTDACHFLMRSRQIDGGWSYNPSVPSDADSTAWCLQALDDWGGFSESDRREARRFMWSHFDGNGISTYGPNSSIRQFIGAPEQYPIGGWTSSHPDVSLAAVLADPGNPNVSRIFEWVWGITTDKGLIPSYWWQSPLYATNLFLRAVKWSGPQPDTRQLEQITDSLTSLLESDVASNAFENALMLEAMIRLCDDSYFSREVVNDSGMALLALQGDDGSWAGEFILRIPVPSVLDPSKVDSWNNMQGGGNARILDEHGLFSTVLACHALNQWLQFIS